MSGLYEKIKKGKTIKRWVQQPLVEILGGEREQDEKYPLHVSVRVLGAEINKKEFAPHRYKKNTLSLHHNDVLLAFMLQTRAAQRGDKTSEFDWDSLIKLGNVEGSSKSNPREARAKIRRKMQRYKELDIIENTIEEKTKIKITPKTSKNKDS